jgi:hypothetical protein
MTRVVFTILLGALIVAAAVVGVNYHNEQMNRLQLEAGRAKLRAEFVERVGVVNAASQADRHHEELSKLVKWYDAQLADLNNTFPGFHDPDAALNEMKAEVAAGRLKSEEMATKKEWYDETKNLYDAIEHGKYEAMVTGVQEGMRVDLLSLKRATYEGKSRLRMDVVVWGAPRREVVTQIRGGQEAHAKMQLDMGFRSVDFEFIDEKEKLVGGGSTGAPTMTVEYPERWIPDFPPEASLMIWYLDPFPAETKTVDLKLGGEVRSQWNAPAPFTQEWKLVAQPDWLIRPGEKFEGEERVMSKEELDRSGRAQK